MKNTNTLVHLNTSYVKVQLKKLSKEDLDKVNLNTSYVKVQQEKCCHKV